MLLQFTIVFIGVPGVKMSRLSSFLEARQSSNEEGSEYECEIAFPPPPKCPPPPPPPASYWYWYHAYAQYIENGGT